MTVNDRIKQIRNANNMTMEVFGKKIGVGKTAISHIESGRANPSERTIMLICREYNVSETWLKTGEGDMSIQKSPEEEITDFCMDILRDESDFRRRFISALAKLDTAQWGLLEDMARTLSGEFQKPSVSDSTK